MLCYWAAACSVDVWQAVGKLGENEQKKKKKDNVCLGVLLCMPIVFAPAAESKATFLKIKDVSFFVQTMQIRVFVPHRWQTGRRGGIREALVGEIV